MKVAVNNASGAFSCDRNFGRGSSLREGTAYNLATERSEPTATRAMREFRNNPEIDRKIFKQINGFKGYYTTVTLQNKLLKKERW